MSLRDELSNVTIPEKFKALEKDIKAMHKIKELDYGEKINIIP